jgi:hypothetical protein
VIFSRRLETQVRTWMDPALYPGKTMSSSDPEARRMGLSSQRALGLSRVVRLNNFLLRFGNENTWIWSLETNGKICLLGPML